MEKVVIIVPMPKVHISDTESLSLNQLQCILSEYPIKLIAPKSKLSSFKNKYPEWDIEGFGDDYFSSIKKYSRLCLSLEFYERFTGYEYMLIYQLDAFVFSDKLIEFCNLDYDFIGAPMPRIWWPKLVVHSFNGGLSLRKVSAFIRITKNFNKILSKMNNVEEFLRCEDAFYSYCGESKEIDFSVPDFSIASQFSLQADTAHCYRKITFDNLPFGCHGWTKKQYFTTWRPFIESTTGSLDNIAESIAKKNGFLYDQMHRIWLDYYYLFPRIMRGDREHARRVMGKILPLNYQYVLWGNGFWGEDAVKCLKYSGLDIAYILDINAEKGDKREDIPVVKPKEIVLDAKMYKVLITTTAYEYEICKILISKQLESDVDFFLYLNIKKLFIDEYYSEFFRTLRK